MTSNVLVPFYYIPYYTPSCSNDSNTIDVNSPIGCLVMAFMIVSIAIMLIIVFDLLDDLFGRKVRRLIYKIKKRRKKK